MIITEAVRASGRTQNVFITDTRRVRLFKEVLAVHSANHAEHIYTQCWQNAVSNVKVRWPICYTTYFKGLIISKTNTDYTLRRLQAYLRMMDKLFH